MGKSKLKAAIFFLNTIIICCLYLNIILTKGLNYIQIITLTICFLAFYLCMVKFFTNKFN